MVRGIGGGAVAALLCWCCVLGGCDPQLETGYHYRPLNASATQRRGYYASPYSPEKAQADQERKQQQNSLSPSAGG